MMRMCAATLAALLLVALVAATALPARASSKKDAEEEPAFEGSVSLMEGFTDNVRADRLLRDGVTYTQLDAQGEWRSGYKWLPDRVGALMRARVYPKDTDRDYAELGPWLGWDWKRLTFDVDYLYSPDHLRVEPDSAADGFADGHDLTGEARSKFGKNKRWTAIMGFNFEALFYDPNFRERSYYEETVETGLRCRATDMVTPRVGFSYSWRDAISSNFDREEAKLLFGFDVYLPWQVRGIFRYEKTWRNFIVGNTRDSNGHRNNNFGREDDAYEIQTGFDMPVPWIDSTVAHLLYRRYDNASSREERSYFENEVSLRFSYDF